MPQVYQRLKEYINFALGFAVAIGFALLSRDRLIVLFQADTPIAVLSAMLAAVTFGQLVGYWQAVTGELELLNDAFDEKRTGGMPTGPTLTIAVALGVGFGALIAASTNILAYSAVLAVYQLLDTAGQGTVNHNVAKMYRAGQFKTDGGEAKAIVLYQYYLERPLLIRGAVLLFVYSGVFASALAGTLSGGRWYFYLAYATTIVTIPAGEWVVHTWRRVRDRDLAALGSAEPTRKAT